MPVKTSVAQLNWDKDESSTVYGYKIKHNTCPILVTYNKHADISCTIQYEDAFVNRYRFSWMTRNNITTSSKEAVAIRQHAKSGLDIHLFIKKGDDEGWDNYYLGKLKSPLMTDMTIADKKSVCKSLPIVNVMFEMDEPVRQDVFDYLVE